MLGESRPRVPTGRPPDSAGETPEKEWRWDETGMCADTEGAPKPTGRRIDAGAVHTKGTPLSRHKERTPLQQRG